jgi:hypothetical protein
MSKEEDAQKIERTYRVDFATAKARLQRALGAFKYDNEKSTFIFESEHSATSGGDSKNVTHRFVISLFPEENGTAVEFTGRYGYIVDDFGGPEKFGKNDYDSVMAGYLSQIDKLLKK